MKVLFIGFGSIAIKHYSALKGLRPDIVIYALKSGSGSSGVPDVKDIYSWSDVPEGIDFAIISNPTYKHKEALTNLISLNIPLFIEKPISHKMEGLTGMEQEIAGKNLISYVACNLRFLPVLQYVKMQLLPRLTAIQEVNVYCGSFLPEWRPHKDYKEFYSASSEMGGGAHLDLFHEIDYTCWLFGLPSEAYSILRSKSSLDIKAVDFASYQLVYPDFVSTLILNYYRRDAKRTLEIVSDEGTYLVNLLNNSVTDAGGNVLFDGGESAIRDTYFHQMKYFLDVLSGTAPQINSFSESLKILKICLQSEKISG